MSTYLPSCFVGYFALIQLIHLVAAQVRIHTYSDRTPIENSIERFADGSQHIS